MSILIKQVRVSGFRGLGNIEVDLDLTTVLIGMNNSGKTSFLKALQLVFGNRQFLSQEDFFITGTEHSDKIIVDSLILPVNVSGQRIENFSDDWEILFTEDRIRLDEFGAHIPLRTEVIFDSIRNNFKTKQYILSEWPEFFSNENDLHWWQTSSGDEKGFRFEELPFFYMDAQRDILDDVRLKSSYLGKMLSKIEYSDEDIATIEQQIKDLNEAAVDSSEVLSEIKATLKELDSAMDSGSEGVEITPFTKKLRDLNKGLSIYYADGQESFSMEYHGMGTRSWSSLLTLKSFIALLEKSAEREDSLAFPILAVEEPEAHLHPNAQKRLYSQLCGITGQKIISTHSPYVAATAHLGELRNFYKYDGKVISGQLDIASLDSEDIRKIKRMVLNTRGEILFSKVLVLFEGETEEQALPIFANKHFAKSPLELGIDFIGVGGYGNYLPFLRLAESLNIPWFILSDADNDVPQSVSSQFGNSGTNRQYEEAVIFVDTANDFEKQLLVDGYADEVKMAIINMGTYHSPEHKTAKVQVINAYTTDELYENMTGQKTKFGPNVAEEIVKSGKALPVKVLELFRNIENILVVPENTEGE